MSKIFASSMKVAGISLALFAVINSPGFALEGPNVIHACVSKLTGTVRIVSSTTNCSSLFETPIDLQRAVASEEEGCPVNMVPVGNICVDVYEASVWSQPPAANGSPQGTQYGATDDDYLCSDKGNDCSAGAANPIYAASVPGVTPSGNITWFQAQQACANVGKRLLRNDEWQMAAAGTPDPGASPGAEDCNTNSGAVDLTGSRSNCVSNWEVYDMVGNLWEWVGDWFQGDTSPWTPSGHEPNNATSAGSDYNDDFMFGINPASTQAANSMNFPGALIRGGYRLDHVLAGVFALINYYAPSTSTKEVGFRCAK